MKKTIKILSITLIILSIIFIYQLNKHNIYTNKVDSAAIAKVERQKRFMECMDKPYQSDDLENDFNNLFAKYQKDGVAIYFTDIKNNYEYNLNENKIYYSASAVKVFDAIYLIEKARKDEINLNDTYKFTSEYVKKAGQKTKLHQLNDDISLKNLIDYAISVSDNAAHFMLVRNIGAPVLNKYFQDSGINLKITNEKPFAYNYTAKIANQSLKRIYDILQTDDEYSDLLRNAMKNTYANYLNFDDVVMLHKYGGFPNYFHDIGIYEGDYPYLVSILTLYGGDKDYGIKIQNIHKEIYDLYQNNLTNKRIYCSKESA